MINQRMVYFVSGNIIATDLLNMQNGKSLKASVKPKFSPEFYTSRHLLYGHEDAEHKLAIFSDPLCPFCRKFVPKAIEEMRQYPKKFAIYYYHMPLPSLHPAALTMVKAAIAAEIRGHDDIVLKMYRMKSIKPRENNATKILTAFNNEAGTTITLEDIRSKEVTEKFEKDFEIANYLLVGGTPTVYFDGELDPSKKQYKQYIGK
jgi:protein-disulfide isomerase